MSPRSISEIFGGKAFLMSLAAIAFPISFQSLVQSGLGMIDQMMIGQSGEAAIAGVGLGGTISFMLMITLGGVVTGGSIFMAQFWGAKDAVHMKKTVVLSTQLGFGVAVLTGGLAAVMPETLLSLFTKDPRVIDSGAVFLRILAFSYLPMFLIMNSASVLRNIGRLRWPMMTGIGAVALNTGLNYALIFGHFGLPALGLKGAAVATLMTRSLEAAILVGLCFKFATEVMPSPKAFLRMDWGFGRRFFKTVYPVFLNEFFWVLGDAMYSVIYGHMGTHQMAAMTMTFPVQGMFIGLFTGLSGAAGILLGNRLGSGDEEAASREATYLMRITVSLGIGLAGLIVLLSPFYLSFYQVGAEARRMSYELLFVFAAVVWVKVSNMVLGNGILRSGGQTNFTFYVDMIGLWGIGVPLGFLTAFYLKLPLAAVYMTIALEEFVRLGLCLIRLKNKKWMAKIIAS